MLVGRSVGLWRVEKAGLWRELTPAPSPETHIPRPGGIGVRPVKIKEVCVENAQALKTTLEEVDRLLQSKSVVGEPIGGSDHLLGLS